jgi:alginate O-acetyltransferase complex protein AlgJ
MRPLEDEVHAGKEGWLFLRGGRNAPLDFYATPDAFPREVADAWKTLLLSRNERATSLGARFVHLIAPEKLTIYPEFFAGELPFYDLCPAIALNNDVSTDKLNHMLVHVVDYMKKLREHYLLYWRTDTHWTFHGCFAAYQMLCSHLGVHQNVLLPQGQTTRGNIVLDLGSKMDPPVREEYEVVNFVRNARCVYTNALINYKRQTRLETDAGLHVGSNVIFVNHSPDANSNRVVLFGDSFAEYRTHLLTGMLAETFRELHFVWSSSIDWGYVERVQPNILVTELAERFMGTLPTDDFDLDSYVVKKLARLYG